MITGECNCGAVGFEISSKLSDGYICHCSVCRKATGSGGIAVVVVDNNLFKWSKGQALIKTWHKPGQDWQTSFCTGCGSPLPGANDEARMYVPVGLITQQDLPLKVAHHIWVDSRANWEVIADAGVQHPQGMES